MTAPFAREQFLGVFMAYNTAIWPLQIVTFALGLIVVVALWRMWPIVGRLVPAILAVLWAVNGVGYHALFFATINPFALLFAMFFIAQAILFALSALPPKGLRFEIGREWRTAWGAVFVIYALAIYPLIGIWAGHGLMKGPIFGVAPCPTTIFTLGLLFMARGSWVAWLAIIPFLWSLIGLAAAWQLGIPEDIALPVAGIVLLIVCCLDAIRPNGPRLQNDHPANQMHSPRQ